MNAPDEIAELRNEVAELKRQLAELREVLVVGPSGENPSKKVLQVRCTDITFHDPATPDRTYGAIRCHEGAASLALESPNHEGMVMLGTSGPDLTGAALFLFSKGRPDVYLGYDAEGNAELHLLHHDEPRVSLKATKEAAYITVQDDNDPNPRVAMATRDGNGELFLTNADSQLSMVLDAQDTHLGGPALRMLHPSGQTAAALLTTPEGGVLMAGDNNGENQRVWRVPESEE